MHQLSLLLPLLFFLASCSSDSEQKEEQVHEPASPQKSLHPKGCKGCHDLHLDSAHDFDCTECHNGDQKSGDKDRGHRGLITRPAHPDTMVQTCGKCHESQVRDASHSLHFTLQNEINLVRFAFGAEKELNSLTEIPVAEPTSTILDLSDDLLRRRCLRCHPYYSGDRYPAIVRGTGCASCHLSFYEGKMESHIFLKTPGDKQCLQCHYGNHVGYDYYGRYEHDMNDEYRTPYTTRDDYFRPFGMEYHQLTPDIHQQRGLLCVDCHYGSELMGGEHSPPACAACHDHEKLGKIRPANILQEKDAAYLLLSKGEKRQHPIPLMEHPAHEKYNGVAGCQVCHARWSYNDKQTHLLRSDVDEYDDFSRLTVQGSFEVEKILKNNLDFEAVEMEHSMSDKMSGGLRSGLWYKGYVSRRWEEVNIGRDPSGRLQVMRPILDLYLSWLDEDEEVRFDAVPANTKNSGMLPYTPHTTGKAGLFYEDRINEFLRHEKKNTH